MRWTHPADPPAMAAARRVAREFAVAHGAAPEAVAAIALCISEAVTNVVMHAYREAGEAGSVEVSAYTDDEGCLWFHVRDDGRGLAPRPDSPGLGLGLPIISQTATGMAVRTPEEGGTEIIMQFDRAGPPDVVRADAAAAERWHVRRVPRSVARRTSGDRPGQRDYA